ncbi:MAG: hypothetical protein HYY84_16880 [Deltaproteobacteria bacterium]|nr:hypothetical protein [Deltaproteobacteria bacterium]
MLPLAMACSGPPVTSVALNLYAPSGQSPLTGVTWLNFTFSGPNLASPTTKLVAASGGTAALTGLPTTSDVTVTVEGLPAFDPATGTPAALSRGSAVAVDFAKPSTLNLFIALVDQFALATSATGSAQALSAARAGHTATLLKDGRVLIAGGGTFLGAASGTPLPSTIIGSVEIFDPRDGSITSIATPCSGTGTALCTPRAYHTATLLKDGRVVLVGGLTFATGGALVSTRAIELFSPTTNSFSASSTQLTENGDRAYHTATLRADGTVLIAGGARYSNQTATPLATADIYTSSPELIAATSTTLATARLLHSATTLKDGRILIAGGQGSSSVLSSTEIFDSTFSPGPTLATARTAHAALRLDATYVVLIGGFATPADPGSITGSIEFYNQDTSALDATKTISLITPRAAHDIALTSGGRILVSGGVTRSGTDQWKVIAAETIEANGSGGFRSRATTAATLQGRSFHRATALANSFVLLSGGLSVDGAATWVTLSHAELYNPP